MIHLYSTLSGDSSNTDNGNLSLLYGMNLYCRCPVSSIISRRTQPQSPAAPPPERRVCIHSMQWRRHRHAVARLREARRGYVTNRCVCYRRSAACSWLCRHEQPGAAPGCAASFQDMPSRLILTRRCASATYSAYLRARTRVACAAATCGC